MKAEMIHQGEAHIPTDEVHSLVALSKQKIQHFDKIFDLYFLPIYNYTLSKVGDRQTAEDIVSQTFLAAMEGLPRYQEKGSFSAWIFTIARSKINDHFRKRKNISDKGLVEFPDPMDDISFQHIQNEELKALRRKIQKLPKKKRELIRLRFVAELSFKEISEVLGKSESAVKKAIYRTMDALKDELENDHA